MAPEMRLRVVSLPATVSSRKNSSSSSDGELLALDLDLGEHAHQVVVGVDPLLGEELGGVGVELHGGLLGDLPAAGTRGPRLPIMRLDQSNIRCRSSLGTPSSSAMTARGSSAAMSVTKSA